jgi:hypothetical protein
MTTNPRRWWSDPIFLTILAAGLLAVVVQSGDLGSVDTVRRLQTTHSFWTSEPPVLAGDYPDFGLRGRDGRIYAWYGIGQSLLMLPTDIVGTYLERLPIFRDYNGNDPRVRDIFVAYSTNILINVLTALVCLRFLTLLNFSQKQSIAGALALLFCTTHLHYTQNMMENNYILLLTLTGFTFQFDWFRKGNLRSLMIGSAALSLNLLTRLTTGLDLLAVGAFLLFVMWLEHAPLKNWWGKIVAYIKIAGPIYGFFFVLDRFYQYYRFGSFFNTYVSVFATQEKVLHPELSANYPFEVPFRVGFFGALFTPEKSIFLFDPLLVLTIVLSVVSMFLRAIHRLEWGFGMGGPLRFDPRPVCSLHLGASTAQISHRGRQALVECRAGNDRHQWRGPNWVACVLASFRAVPDDDTGPSNVRRMPTVRKHCGVHSRQDGRLGAHKFRYDHGPLGLRPHHDVEFSAVRVAPSGRSARVGGAGCPGHVVGVRRKPCVHTLAPAEDAGFPTE